MTVLSEMQHDLIVAADRGRLSVSAGWFYRDGTQLDMCTSRAAADMVADGLLYLPDAVPGRFLPVRATDRGLVAAGLEVAP